MSRCLRVLAALLASMALAAAGEVRAEAVKTAHVTADLIAETAGAAPGSTLYVALRQRLLPGWHTYWRNPGDSGQATSLNWTLPPGWKAGEIVWPTPERIVVGPLTNYGFGGEVVLPVPVQVPSDAKPGQTVALRAKADWLVCKDVCVPESANLTLDIPVVAGSPSPGGEQALVAGAVAAAPKPSGLQAAFRSEGGTVKLAVTGAAVADAEVSHAWFFPYDGAAIDHAGPQKAARGARGLTLDLPPGIAFQNHKPPAQMAGVLSLGPGKAYEITALPGPAPAGASGLAPPAPTSPETGVPPRSRGGGAALAGFAAAAFLGGLILNLMPCVFPVLSIKAAALVRHGGAPRAARTEGLAFAAGVVATFVTLAVLLLGLRAAGQAVGWGFQLQSPGVVAALTLLMLLVALNLSGVFEVGGSAQDAGSELAGRADLAGAFFTGALAVVVAAPCSAPFMAGAVGWAVTQSAPVALLVFVALGLGLAAPFTALSFSPALLRLLPKPGAWMEGLRRVLAFPMYGAAAWLAWVFSLQAGSNGLAFLFAAAVVTAFAAWLWGAGQTNPAPLLPRLLAGAAIAAAVPLVVTGASASAPAQASAGMPVSGALASEAWSPERVAALRAEGRPVFVDFTAAWCVTCQVNERTALAAPAVREAFQRSRAVYLKADWTNRDDRIAQALGERGRSGVPLYLLYDAKGSAEPRVLPQLLTEGGVVAALDEAGGHQVAAVSRDGKTVD